MQRIYPWLFALFGFSIPITTAGSNLFLALVFCGAFSLPERRARLAVYLSHPVARAALMLFGFALVGCLHGAATPKERIDFLWKYFDLLLIGLLIPLLGDPAARLKALWGFAASQVLTLALSTLFWLGALPDGPWRVGFGSPNTSATIFKLYIQQSWLMALFALLAFLLAGTLADRRWRAVFYGTAALATVNILFMVQGRTGYIVLAALVVYGFFLRFRWRGIALAALGGLLIGTVGLKLSPQLTSGVTRALADMRTWNPDAASAGSSSLGLRLDYWRHTLPIVVAHPLTGVGTGSFPSAFARQVENTTVVRTINPHQQYLMTAAENGLPALAALLFLFVTIWRTAAGLPVLRRDLARGLVLATAIGCLFNSFLRDHTEGMFFAWAIAALFGASPVANQRAPLSTAP